MMKIDGVLCLIDKPEVRFNFRIRDVSLGILHTHWLLCCSIFKSLPDIWMTHTGSVEKRWTSTGFQYVEFFLSVKLQHGSVDWEM